MNGRSPLPGAPDGACGGSWSSDNAVAVALEKAASTIKNIDWFQVTEARGHTQNGKIRHWQVTLKVRFRLED
jgi:flavin-binding protein dodecin